MTPDQIKLARHALGLDRAHPTAYRNYFVTGEGCADYEAWKQMVANGDATRRDGAKLPFGGDDLFNLTKQGADKALQPGEQIGPDCF